MSKFKEFLLNILEKYFPNYIKLGDEALNKKQYNKALEYYQKAEKIQGKNPRLFFHWASCWFALGNYDNAIKLFERAVKLKPDYAEALSSWGITFYTVNRFDDAIRKFKEATKADANDVKSYIYWGMTLERTGKPDKSEELYKKALEVNALLTGKDSEEIKINKVMALNQIALLRLRADKLNEAAKTFEEITKTDQSFAPAYYNLSIIYARANKPDLSIKNLKQAIRLDPQSLIRAKEEPVFKPYLTLPEFKELLG